MIKFFLIVFLIGSVLLSLYRKIIEHNSSKLNAAHSKNALNTSLSKQEACEILGVSPDASAEEITKAHLRLMKQIHPDAGGNHYFATRLNMARDTLLK